MPWTDFDDPEQARALKRLPLQRGAAAAGEAAWAETARRPPRTPLRTDVRKRENERTCASVPGTVHRTGSVQNAGPVSSASMKTLPVNWLLTLGDQATGVLAIPFLRYRSTRITVALMGLFIYPVSRRVQLYKNALVLYQDRRASTPLTARLSQIGGHHHARPERRVPTSRMYSRASS